MTAGRRRGTEPGGEGGGGGTGRRPAGRARSGAPRPTAGVRAGAEAVRSGHLPGTPQPRLQLLSLSCCPETCPKGQPVPPSASTRTPQPHLTPARRNPSRPLGARQSHLPGCSDLQVPTHPLSRPTRTPRTAGNVSLSPPPTNTPPNSFHFHPLAAISLASVPNSTLGKMLKDVKAATGSQLQFSVQVCIPQIHLDVPHFSSSPSLPNERQPAWSLACPAPTASMRSLCSRSPLHSRHHQGPHVSQHPRKRQHVLLRCITVPITHRTGCKSP